MPKGSAIILKPEHRDEFFEILPYVSRMPARDNLVFRCSFFGAMRVCEIADLDVDSTLGPRGEILDCIRIKPGSTKGSEGRTIKMHRLIREALEDLLDVYPDATCVAISPRDGRQMKAGTLGRAMERLYRDAGFAGCRSHTGRASCITEMATLANLHGSHLGEVQRFAGHKQLETTAGYLGATGSIGDLVDALGSNTNTNTNRGGRRNKHEKARPAPTYWEPSLQRSPAGRQGRSAIAREPRSDGHGGRDAERLASRDAAKRRSRRKLRQNRPARRDR